MQLSPLLFLDLLSFLLFHFLPNFVQNLKHAQRKEKTFADSAQKTLHSINEFRSQIEASEMDTAKAATKIHSLQVKDSILSF